LRFVLYGLQFRVVWRLDLEQILLSR